MPGYGWQAMYFSPEMERDFIKMDLGPTLKENNYANVSLIILDDNRFQLPRWVDPVSMYRILSLLDRGMHNPRNLSAFKLPCLRKEFARYGKQKHISTYCKLQHIQQYR